MPEFKIIVRCQNYWSKADTISEALGKLKTMGAKTKYYEAYIVHPDSYCEECFGAIVHSRDFRPKLIHSVSPKKLTKRKK